MSFNVISIFSVIFLTSVAFRYGSACEGIKNVLVEVETIDGSRSNITLSGCIQRSSFDGTHIDGRKIGKIFIRHQNIPSLGKDYVKHLVKMETLEITDCKIESIAREAFRNLLRIRLIAITHNLLTEVTGGIFDIFDTLKILRLNNNRISSITDEALSNMTVREVDFSHNNFTVWKSVWFAYSPNIEKLDFSFNKIKTIPTRAFVGMPVLKEVNFEHNQLNFIEKEAFKGLISLQILNLRSNSLGSLEGNIFPSKIKITSLNIAANRLFNLEENTLEKLNLNEIIIDHNPWLCACMTNLHFWLNTNNVAVKKADDCNMNQLPVCINTERCESPRSDQGITMYYHIIDNLNHVDRKCIGL